MEFKGTKGKWESSKDEFDNSIISCNGYYLGEVRKEFDALLISKAPEMLEMLKEFIKAIDDEEIIIHENYDNDGYENCGRRLYENFKQIIKEATEIK